MSQVSSTLHLERDFYASTDQVSKKKKKLPKPKYERDDDTTCGIGSCRPQWLQKLVHPIPFLIVYSLLGMVQGLLWSYYVGVFTTLERRFSYKSKITGIISLSDNFGNIFSSLVIAYFGGAGHRPRWIAAGMIIAAIGALISASPYWVFGPDTHLTALNHGSSRAEICQASDSNDSQHCSDDESSRKMRETIPAVCLVILGNIVNGIGITAFYIVGAPYLDDNIKKTLTPIYFGVMYAVRLFGPALGFFLASATLQIYENPFETPNFGPTDPRWVGAWWLGFVIISALLVIFSAILYLFPRRIKWSDDDDAMQKSNTVISTMSNNNESKKSTKDTLKELSKVLLILIKNRTLMFRYGAECFNLLGVLGFVLFMPKYLENQFRQGASDANKLAGLAGTLFMVVGFCLSAIVISCIKPSARYVSAWMALTGFIHATALIVAGSITCDNRNVITSSPCFNNDCYCETAIYSPVCYEQKTYFSACFVGCKDTAVVNGTQVFENCECNDGNSTASIGVVQPGFCPSSCNLLSYLIIIVIANLFSSSAKVGGILITLRSVATSQKSIALAISSIMLCVFAFIPCPLLYGSVIDSSCEVWETSCGETGNCWIYNIDKFRYLLHGLSAAFIIVGAIFDSFTCYYSKSIKNLYEENTGDGDATKDRHSLDTNGTALSDRKVENGKF